MSALQALKGSEPAEALKALAYVTQSFLPNPGINETESAPSELAIAILSEIQSYYPPERREQSSKARANLYRLLSSEMTNAALAGIKRNEVQQRLGERGILWPYRYKVVFSRFYLQNKKDLDVGEEEITRAVHHPTDSKHYFRQQNTLDAYALSLFIRDQKKKEVPHKLLVIANRNNDTLEVKIALRVIAGAVSTEKEERPLDVLKAFTDRYGLEVQVGDKAGKFFYYEHFDGPATVNYIKKSNALGFGLVRTNSNSTDVAVVFEIDMDAYKASLREHGLANVLKVRS